MAGKYHEKLATIIVDEIMKARTIAEYDVASKELSAIRNAFKVAEGRSRLECDLRRFMKIEPFYYNEEDIEITMHDLSEKVGKEVHFRTITLHNCLTCRLANKIKDKQDLWETAKIIYSFGTLYDDNDDEVSEIVYAIKDDEQRRLATICAREYFDGFEKVFDVFNLDTKI